MSPAAVTSVAGVACPRQRPQDSTVSDGTSGAKYPTLITRNTNNYYWNLCANQERIWTL